MRFPAMGGQATAWAVEKGIRTSAIVGLTLHGLESGKPSECEPLASSHYCHVRILICCTDIAARSKD